MEREFFRFVSKYRWSIFGCCLMFIVSILVIVFGFWPAFVVVFVSVLGLLIGYVKDQQIDVMQILRNLK